MAEPETVPEAAPETPVALRECALTADDLQVLVGGAALVPRPAALFRIEGPGAVACVQGIVTNDVQKRGPDTLCYGALLTPKGMLAVECWLLRDGDAILLIADPAVHATALDLFRRQLPPRLARVHDWSATHEVRVAVGSTARAGAGVPAEAGKVARADGAWIAQAPAAAPFGALLVTPAGAATPTLGLPAGAPLLGEAARILAGFPAHGAEIDAKTLPQEIRFDEHDGVSYTKGCYTGQETVARIHFRGHPNRELRALRFAAGAITDPARLEIRAGEKVVGTVRSLLRLPDGRAIGLAPVRREVEPGSVVEALGGTAEVVVPPVVLPETTNGRP